MVAMLIVLSRTLVVSIFTLVSCDLHDIIISIKKLLFPRFRVYGNEGVKRKVAVKALGK